MPEHVVILRTGRLHEFEMACNALEKSGVPHFKQEESSSGLKTAMYNPAMAPGSFWNLLVPVSEKLNAEKIISDLPIDNTTDPDLWHFGAKPKRKKIWKVCIIIYLFILGILFVYNLLKSII